MDQNIIHQAMNEQELIQAYKNEKDVKTKERLFLVKQIFFDNQTASHVGKNLGHVRSWPSSGRAGSKNMGWTVLMTDKEQEGRQRYQKKASRNGKIDCRESCRLERKAGDKSHL